MKLSLIESRLFGRFCYGFKRDQYGFVEIVPEQAEVVKTIFRMYREENCLENIQKYLLSRSISSHPERQNGAEMFSTNSSIMENTQEV